MTTPTWGQPPQPVPPTPGMSARKKGCLGCGGATVGVFILLLIIGLIVGPQKKANTAAKAAQTTPVATSSAPAVGPSPTKPSPSAAPSHKPSPTPQHSSSSVNQLAHGAQDGLSNCMISYKDAQMGAGTSTFSAIVLNDSGQVYAPTGSNPYSVMFELTVTGTDGTSYAVTEALGNGSRTAADNPSGSDWFTTNQGDVQVSANSKEGTVASTVPVPLAQVKSVRGDIMVTSQNDNNYLKQMECVVRPTRG
jgi:hypothetical protein